MLARTALPKYIIAKSVDASVAKAHQANRDPTTKAIKQVFRNANGSAAPTITTTDAIIAMTVPPHKFFILAIANDIGTNRRTGSIEYADRH